jgi:YggT family protein
MLYQIISLVLDVVTGLIVAACLLRAYMQFHRVNLSARMGNPLAPFVFTLSNWLVLPLRKVLPAVGRTDSASLVAAYVVLLLKSVLLSILISDYARLPHVWMLSLVELLHLSISGLFWLVIMYAVLSWVQAQSALHYLLVQLVDPLLRPIRRVLPLLGGIDLSPLALLLALQILEILLTGLLQWL